jgi:hypothetical protein
MTAQIGQSQQIQPNIIQNSVQQNAQKIVQRDAQPKPQTVDSRPQGQNQNFQKLAEQILAQRSANTETVKPTIDRGQVVDLLV